MNKLILKLLTLFLATSFISCNKNKDSEDSLPSANFTTDKSEYVGGEIIHLTNSSTNGNTFRWTMPEGNTLQSTNADYTTKTMQVEQSLTFKLEAFSKSGTKSDYSIQVIKVKPPVGKIILYAGQFVLNADITIDGKSEGTVTFPNNNTTPTVCDQTGYPTFTLTAGSHIIVGTRGPYTYTLKVDIKANTCTIAKLD